MLFFNAVHNFFVWLGYGGFWQWYIGSWLDNTMWITHFVVVVVLIWVAVEELWGKNIVKRIRSFRRWLRQHKKPGVPSDHDLLLANRKTNRKLKEKVKQLTEKLQQLEHKNV